MAGGLLRVEPSSVVAAASELRRASQLYAATGWRLATNLPSMPPTFMASVQLELDLVAARLQALAVRLDLDAATEAWRMSRLEDADTGDFGAAIAQLVGDLGVEGRQAWGSMVAESGPQALGDPVGGNAHLLEGVGDNLFQLLELATMFGHLNPGYANTDPAGATSARQEVLAMAVNLMMLVPEVAAVDPEGHRRAVAETAAKVTDWQDLERGDLPRWVGHVGTGILLGTLVSSLTTSGGAAATAGADLDAGDTGAAVDATYKTFGQANRLPTQAPPGGGGGDSPVQGAFARVESFLEHRKGR